jgi:hypothetical protein
MPVLAVKELQHRLVERGQRAMVARREFLRPTGAATVSADEAAKAALRL